MEEASLPFVSIITVNYNGRFFLKQLLDSIYNLDYPKDKLQIIMVDNGSQDDSVELAKKNYPFVEILALKNNLGFAAGNNAGVKLAKGDYIAFINNDCVVERGWLKNMVMFLSQKKDKGLKVGGVGSKVYFYFKYIPVKIIMEDLDVNKNESDSSANENEYESSTNKNESENENEYYGIIKKIRIIGINVCRDSNGNYDDQISNHDLLRHANDSIKYLNGFFGIYKDLNKNIIRKIKKEALLAIPIFDTEKDLNLEIETAFLKPDINLRILCADEEIFNYHDDCLYDSKEIADGEALNEGDGCKKTHINENSECKKDVSQNDIIKTKDGLLCKKFNLIIPESKFVYAKDIINSCGSMINKSFYAKEIGYDSIEENVLDESFEVFAVPGSSFLVKKELIREIKLFDEKFFTYYEDIDFFWRARLKGWKFFVEPKAVARHFHCGSGQEWSYNFTYYVLRNRLLMIYKCCWFSGFIKNYISFCAAAFINFIYLVINKIRRKSLDRIDITIRMRIFFELFILMACFLGKRISIRKGSIISDEEIKTWQKNF
ncbi:MAG: glycosyltransferase [Actinomycetota bacterium]|nr:glycosyltransferase [Actinomycetota bacterium]